MARVRVKVPVEQPSVKTKTVKSVQEPANHQVSPVPRTLSLSPRTTMVLVGGLLVLLLILVINLNSDKNQLKQELGKTSSSQVQDEAQRVVDEIKGFTELPTGDKPRLLTVSDATKFAEQYPEIKNGDQIVLFETSRKMVIYRPSTKKIVAAITLPPNADTPATTNNR